MGRQIGLPLALTLGAVLALEGVLSLIGGPRIAERLRPEEASAPAPSTDAPSAPAVVPASRVLSAGGEVARGLYANHPDPRVGYRFQRGAELELVGQAFRTDKRGYRARPAGPPPPADAFRVLVLGDSVAFGYGVADDQTLGARLERELSDLAPEGARAIVAATVAVPSWNHRQALAALENHWHEYAPDLVVFVPISNDLGSANGLDGYGRHRAQPDLAEEDPWLLVSRRVTSWIETRRRELEAQGVTIGKLGPRATEAALSPESRRRYDANAASILAMRAFAAARGAGFAVFLNGESRYTLHLARRLELAEPAPLLTFGQRRTTAEMSLGFDPHPNATTLRWRAVWLAGQLLEQGLLPLPAGLAAQLPAAPPRYAELRFDPREEQGLATRVEQVLRYDADLVQPTVALADLTGTRQIHGGLNIDGTTRFHLSLALRAATRRLGVELASIPERPDLLPIDVDVYVDEARVGAVRLAEPGPASASFELPAGLAPGAVFDVHLRPSRWGVRPTELGDQVSSFQLLRVTTE